MFYRQAVSPFQSQVCMNWSLLVPAVPAHHQLLTGGAGWVGRLEALAVSLPCSGSAAGSVPQLCATGIPLTSLNGIRDKNNGNWQDSLEIPLVQWSMTRTASGPLWSKVSLVRWTSNNTFFMRNIKPFLSLYHRDKNVLLSEFLSLWPIPLNTLKSKGQWLSKVTKSNTPHKPQHTHTHTLTHSLTHTHTHTHTHVRARALAHPHIRSHTLCTHSHTYMRSSGTHTKQILMLFSFITVCRC